MKNIERSNPFKTTIQKNDIGILTNLLADEGVSSYGCISFAGKTLLANYIYLGEYSYKLQYTTIDTDGNEESFIEDDGFLPTLFISPDNETYVSMQTHRHKELEISIPVLTRDTTEEPKPNRPFVGDFIGTLNQFSIFYNVDSWSKDKPDKFLAIEFKNGAIKKKHNVKVPLPRRNNIFISDNEMHLLCRDNNTWLHRQTDEKGNVLSQRQLGRGDIFYREIVSLSFEKDSYLLAQEKDTIIIERIDSEGNGTVTALIDFPDRIYSTWLPQKIAEDTYVIRFTSEFGNGWLTTRNDQLIELFYNKDEKGYKNLVTNEILALDEEKLILSGISKTVNNAYAAVFYTYVERPAKNKKLIVLNRTISNTN
jgi:hypothetical protein